MANIRDPRRGRPRQRLWAVRPSVWTDGQMNICIEGTVTGGPKIHRSRQVQTFVNAKEALTVGRALVDYALDQMARVAEAK